jgi:hypothetical protein
VIKSIRAKVIRETFKSEDFLKKRRIKKMTKGNKDKSR